MPVAEYVTDLGVITDAESGDSWGEFVGMTQGDVASEGETDYYIQGNSCASSDFNNKSGLHSNGVNYGSDLSGSFGTGGCFFSWHVILPGNAMDTFDNGGLRSVVGSSLSNWNAWKSGGNDYGRNPYGGWQNYVAWPQATPDYTGGSGHGGVYQYFGAAANVLSPPSKGTQHGWDAMYYGRGTITITEGTAGAPANYTDLAAYNDTGPNRFGLFQNQQGSFLWKGMISYGSSSTACYFLDQNKSIIVDDAPATYEEFNMMRIYNSSTEVYLTSMVYSSLGATSPGTFQVVADTTAYLDACLFKDWGKFYFQSKSTVDGTTFLRCDSVTQNSASIINTLFSNSIGSAALKVDAVGSISNLSFVSSGTGWAMEGFSSTGSYTLNSITYNGYDSGTGPSGATGDRALHILATAGTATIFYPGGDLPSYYSEGAAVLFIADSYDFKFTLSPSITGYEWRIYSVTALGSLDGAVELTGEETATVDNQTYTYEYASDVNIGVQIISQPVKDYIESATYYILSDGDQDINIILTKDENN
jgi:hypothetical protein